ncbi:MAG: nitronate monooxygenase [Gammaproteobacteria bacterium]|nr:nitronate monooxygenase [Gammaproteobacteria bacterium]MDH5800341.1 nitronate monooxygenase [Gammaproteobacteria bacterium]
MTQDSSLAWRSFCESIGITIPVIGGPMYPCSNPELVAAVSEAGGIGVVQPVTMTYVFGYDFRSSLRYIRSLTQKPIGMNALIEQSSARYRERMEDWIQIALEEGVAFFITSLGKPDWVVDMVHAHGGLVFHDVTEIKWAEKGLSCGVDGLIAVNNRAGGHAGALSAQSLWEQLSPLGVPLICAGGISTGEEYTHMLNLGYAGVQMGTRFIASQECSANEAYKEAIVRSQEKDIVMSETITGVPVSVIETEQVKRAGVKPGAVAGWLLGRKSTKHWMRLFYALKSIRLLKKALLDSSGRRDYWQAGKSVAGIDSVESVSAILQGFEQTRRNTLE